MPGVNLPGVNADAPASLEAQAASLFESVRTCELCPRMVGRTRVLGPGNGCLRPRILFVAEAPGRLGADRSGIPLHGDQTGRNFEALLAHLGAAREDVLITNAVLCNPQDAAGNNAPPGAGEIARCRTYLQQTIDLTGPEVVAALGRVALESLRKIEAHTLTLADAGTLTPWYGRHLAALFHPGARARIHRPPALQLADIDVLRPYVGSKKPPR